MKKHELILFPLLILGVFIGSFCMNIINEGKIERLQARISLLEDASFGIQHFEFPCPNCKTTIKRSHRPL